MEPKIPEWITSDFLKQSLESDDSYRGIDIIDFKSSPAAPAGNNYGSLVVRVAIDCKLRGEERKLSVVIKGPVTEGVTAELLKTLKNSEPSFYNVFLPKAYKLAKIRFAPNNFHSPIPSAVILEDLKESGYLMADRVKQLDYEHCLLYTKAAAAFHASSIILCKQNPDIISTVSGANCYSDEFKGADIIRNMNRWGLECMANHTIDSKISKIMKDSAEHIWGLLVELHRPRDDINSLLQGDPWTTNMMFKYDGRGNVCDIKLLDFQNLLYSSPVNDLVVFIWSSANDDVRKHRLSDLYSNYLKELNSNLRAQDFPEIDQVSFKNTIKKLSPLALTTAANSVIIRNPTTLDLGEIITKSQDSNASVETNPIERYYTEHLCQTVLPQIVDSLATEGVFDYLEEKIKSLS